MHHWNEQTQKDYEYLRQSYVTTQELVDYLVNIRNNREMTLVKPGTVEIHNPGWLDAAMLLYQFVNDSRLQNSNTAKLLALNLIHDVRAYLKNVQNLTLKQEIEDLIDELKVFCSDVKQYPADSMAKCQDDEILCYVRWRS